MVYCYISGCTMPESSIGLRERNKRKKRETPELSPVHLLVSLSSLHILPKTKKLGTHLVIQCIGWKSVFRTRKALLLL